MGRTSFIIFYIVVAVLLLLSECSILGIFSATTHLIPTISTDQSALLSFKSRINFPPQHVLVKNWSSATPACSWIGVSCSSRHQRIIALNLSNMGLKGTIPPEIGNLSFLVSLNLQNNGFHGLLPTELSGLKRLKGLYLSFNNFNTQFPSWLTNLPKLHFLDLSVNSFTGTIPPSISNITNLELLSLQENSLQGYIPEGIGSLGNLKWIDLRHNNLSGSIPDTIFNISTLISLVLANNSFSGYLPHGICHGIPRIERLQLGLNQFSGPIPSNLHECSKLEFLALRKNQFSGIIPREIGNLTMLEELYLDQNNLRGELPQETGSLGNLKDLVLEFNGFSGTIPATTFNISTLEIFSIVNNNFSGGLPSSIGHNLPNLKAMYFSLNSLTGILPDSLSNSSQLTLLDFCNNEFTGTIPTSFGKLELLENLKLEFNKFTSESSFSEFSFLTSLTNCRHLKVLAINSNHLSGYLPTSMGNLSNVLEGFYASENGIKGSIPNEIGNLSSLTLLSFGQNMLTGNIPLTIKRLSKLQVLEISYNKLQGSIPNDLCQLKNLFSLTLTSNQFIGQVPECLGNLASLRYIALGSNRLTSSLPVSLGNLKDLLEFNVSSNSLSGHLPSELGNLKVVIKLDLSHNQFSGYIPSVLGRIQSLVTLSIQNNRLQGPIPDTFQSMVSIVNLDLSHNNLSGVIPKSLEALSDLKYFNVSYNSLRGEIPSGGPFKNFTYQSFLWNEALCGDFRFQVKPCLSSVAHGSRTKNVLLVVCIVLGIAITLLILSFALVLLRRQRRSKAPSQNDLSPVLACGRISYQELQEATDGFDESNLLGKGSFGSVYKGTLENGTIVAIKVFNLEQDLGFKSFDVECEVLCNLRHRNLGKVISSCSNLYFKALVLEYMPNGSLEKWLYSHNHFLNILQRIDIMIDVGCALDYLHQGYSTLVVHCDLKPSNVLLDKDMVAHLSDFGMAKLLGDEESITKTMTLATIGYIAPEYGQGGLVSRKCDIYSYGIMLMEIFTRTKPSDEKFNGDLSLKSWVRDSLPKSVIRVIDENLLKPEEEHRAAKVQCLSSIMELAVSCSAESPGDRIDMDDVLAALRKIRFQYLEIYRIGV